MPVDTSMYPQPGPPQNPLQTLSTLVGIRNANLQGQGMALHNELTGRTMDAQQAVGNAIQGATGPDGQMDPNAMMTAVAHDPRAAFAAAEAQQFAQQQRVSQVGLAMQKQDRLNTVLGSTLAAATKEDGSFDESRLTPEMVTNSVGELVNEGVLDAKTAASELGSMPTDPGQRYAWLKGHMAQGLDAASQIRTVYGSLVQNDNGAQIITNRVPEMGGTMAPITKQLSPGEATSPVAAVDYKNQPIVTMRKTLVKRGSLRTGQSPEALAAAGVTGQGNAHQGMELQTAANEVPQIKSILGSMQGDLKFFTTGPGSGEWKHLLAAGAALGLPVNRNAVASQENFNKFATMLAQRTGAMFGGNGSDQRFLAAVDANPNQALSSEGNRRIINILKGNMDAIATANKGWQAWQQQGHGGESFGQYMQRYNQNFDPRFFQMQYMNKAEQNQMLSGMSGQEKSQFEQRLSNAVKKGWLSDPRKSK